MAAYVKMLGPPRVEVGEAWLMLPSGKTSALLYYLAYQGDWVSRDELLYLFWPDSAEKPARRNLRQLLSTIRRLPFAHGLKIEDTRVRWGVPTDVREFNQALFEGKPSLAAGRYEGELLQGYRADESPEFESWLEMERQGLGARWRDAVLSFAGELEETDRHVQAADLLARLVKADPLDEEALRHYLRSLYRGNQRARALEAFELFSRKLKRELDGEPEAPTLRLVESMRRGETLSTQLAAATTGAAVLTGSPLRPKSNLPLQATPFIGRQEEKRRLADLLSDPACRLLTLVGPGGIGKTRLALEAARAQLEAFGGVWFVPLESVSSPEEIAPAIAGAVNFSFYGTAEPKAQLLDYLRDKEMLLVLDNLEHLLAGANVIAELLETAPKVKLLATSRERLNLRAEWIFTLGGLTFPQKTASAPGSSPGSSAVQRFDAVQLFLACARRADGNFIVEEGDMSFVAHICNLVEGMPLAIELSAAWLHVLSLEDIAKEVSRGLDVLQTSRRDVAERHRSIRTVLDHSWALLSEEEKAVFRRLAVFRGGFGREAAGEVAGASLALLAGLVEKSLLRVASGRYDFHALLFSFARERLAEHPEEQAQTESKHGAYFFRCLKRQEMWRSNDEASLAAIDEELENVRAAWRWASAGARAQELESASDLVVYFDRRGRFREGVELFSQAARRLDEADPAQRESLGALSIAEAWLRFRLGEYQVAGHLAEHGLALSHAQASKTPMKAHNILGLIAERTGQYDQAKSHVKEALKRAKACGELARAAGYLTNLADIEGILGNYHEAIEHYEEALALHRRLSQPFGMVNALNNLGYLQQRLGGPERAYPLMQEGLALAKKINFDDAVPSLLGNLAAVFQSFGDYAKAQALGEEALELMRDEEDPSYKAPILSTLGEIATALGNFPKAHGYFLESLALSWSVKEWPNALETLISLAELRIRQENDEQACELLGFAVHHPATRRYSLDPAQTLLQGLAKRLSPEAWQAALERGRAAAPDELVGKLLADVDA